MGLLSRGLAILIVVVLLGSLLLGLGGVIFQTQ